MWPWCVDNLRLCRSSKEECHVTTCLLYAYMHVYVFARLGSTWQFVSSFHQSPLLTSLSSLPPPLPHPSSPSPPPPPLPHPSSPSQVSTAAMQSILKRMQFQDYIQIVSFSDYIILNKPIEEWPLCDCLIAFYSKGFPLDKAIAYVNLRHPFVINDLEMQYNLMDR